MNINRLPSSREFRKLVGLLLVQTVSGATPVTQWIDTFEPAGLQGNSYSGGQIGSVWRNWFGAAFQSLVWDSANDADGNAASGSMKIQLNFPGSGNNQFTIWNGITGISPTVNALQFKAFECDVKFASGSATVKVGSVSTFGHLQFGIAPPNYSQEYFVSPNYGTDIPASNTGWVHIRVPLDVNQSSNLSKIANLLIHIWGGTSLAGASTMWIDNIKFTGTTLSGSASVNWQNRRQMIDGFGASSAWDSSWSTALADSIFSTNGSGVGLSLLRSRIAPDGSSVETSIMQMAQARGARVWSTPWTPPASMKSSNSINGGSFIANTTNMQNYANQLANYVDRMKTTYGIRLHAISLQNEPDASTTYESCIWTAQQLHDFIPYVAQALSSRGLSQTKIALPEGMHWDFSLAADTATDPLTRSHIGILAGHSYGSSAAAVAPLTPDLNVPLWQTEHYFGTGDTISDGLLVGTEIHEYLTIAQANAYHYWWLKSSGNGSIMGSTPSAPAKRFYVMGQYSKFVRPGDQRIEVIGTNTTALISAYIKPSGNDVTIVAINPTPYPITQRFVLNGAPTISSITPWITSDSQSLQKLSSLPVANQEFSYEIPASCVLSFVTASDPKPLIVLTGSDSINNSSFNVKGGWNDTIAPSSGRDYTAAQYILRTPNNAGSVTFAGDALTLPLLSSLRYKGNNNQTLTLPLLILDGGTIDNGNASCAFTLAGQVEVRSDSIIWPQNDSTRSINIAASIRGAANLNMGYGGTGTVQLSGDNRGFTGKIEVNGGTTLRLAAAQNLGDTINATNAERLTLNNGVLISTSSLQIPASYGGLKIGSGGGTLAPAASTMLAVDGNTSGTGGLTKSGAGSLRCQGFLQHSGGTRVSAGDLFVNGTCSHSAALTVDAGARLGGSGTIDSALELRGNLAPGDADACGVLNCRSSVRFFSTSRYEWELADVATTITDQVLATSVVIDSGAALTLTFNRTGSRIDFSQNFWKLPRRWPLISSPVTTGALALNSVSPDAFGNAATSFGQFSLATNNTGTELRWTPVTPPIQQWRVTYFQTTANSGIAANTSDPDGDGWTNLLEYATGNNPLVASANVLAISRQGQQMRCVFSRNPNASDVSSFIEWSTNLSGNWSSSGLEYQTLSSNPSWQSIQASVPLNGQPRLFLRLRVTEP